MGRSVESVIEEYNSKGPEIPVEVALKIDLENMDTFTPDSLQGIDVAIESGQPGICSWQHQKCLDSGVAVVCGTTGWYQHVEEVKAYCQERNGTLLYTPNFSVGVNILLNSMKSWQLSCPAVQDILLQ